MLAGKEHQQARAGWQNTLSAVSLSADDGVLSVTVMGLPESCARPTPKTGSAARPDQLLKERSRSLGLKLRVKASFFLPCRFRKAMLSSVIFLRLYISMPPQQSRSWVDLLVAGHLMLPWEQQQPAATPGPDK